MKRRVVLITGASSGIGRATARLLQERGYVVIGTSRHPEVAEPAPGVEMVQLDVSSDESVAACIDWVVKQTGRIDVLINNAGYVLRGAAEEASLEQARAQFEVNFFGAVRMAKRVLPLMRAQRGGHIINISSVTGFSPNPFVGIYSASKHALEAYTEALRHEVRPFGIKVVLIEPIWVKTGVGANADQCADQIEDYGRWRQRAQDAARASVERAVGPEVVAACALRALESKNPRLRYQVGKGAHVTYLRRRLLPVVLWDRFIRDFYNLGDTSPE